MHRFLPLVFIAFVLIAPACFGQSTEPDTSFHANQRPNLQIKHRKAPIQIDGELGDEGWVDAESVGGFCNTFPTHGTKPKVCTFAKMTYDDDFLYIAMIAEDPYPADIRASYSPRDKIWGDDFMGIILDTYGDGTRCFEIYANARGVQGDLFWTPSNEVESYNMIYQTEGKITEKGWQLEMKIPFRSLRFPDIQIQNFHCSFWRSYPRDRVYKYSWADVNFNVPCAFCQFGTISGIENIHPAGSFEVLPSLVASQYAARDNGTGAMANSPLKLNPSLGLRYVLGTATGLELAVNPDFSQVES
ncbi:MAG: carbohydrate binding family 9 domain-containing protein, partial [Ignavibacteriota bacterium]